MFYGRMFRDSEVSAVYVYRKPVDADRLTLQKEEVESVMWMGLQECVEAVRNGGIPNCIYPDELKMIERYLGRDQGVQTDIGHTGEGAFIFSQTVV